MAKLTINEAMVLAKAVRGRYSELSHLRSSVSTKETWFGDKNKVVEPEYNVKDVDKKCVELENFLLVVDSKIKQSNAVTTIDVDFDVKVLLAPLT